MTDLQVSQPFIYIMQLQLHEDKMMTQKPLKTAFESAEKERKFSKIHQVSIFRLYCNFCRFSKERCCLIFVQISTQYNLTYYALLTICGGGWGWGWGWGWGGSWGSGMGIGLKNTKFRRLNHTKQCSVFLHLVKFSTFTI